MVGYSGPFYAPRSIIRCEIPINPDLQAELHENSDASFMKPQLKGGLITAKKVLTWLFNFAIVRHKSAVCFRVFKKPPKVASFYCCQQYSIIEGCSSL